MKRKLSQSRSRGYLMLDLMVAMTLTMVILSFTSVWMYKTMRYSADVNQRESHSRNISRISHQLRIDAHDASSISVEGNLLTIGIPNQSSIEYSILANSVHRKLAAGSNTHQDRFDFATNAKLEWDSQEVANSAALNVSRDFSQMSTSKDATSKRLDAQVRIRANGENRQ